MEVQWIARFILWDLVRLTLSTLCSFRDDSGCKMKEKTWARSHNNVYNCILSRSWNLSCMLIHIHGMENILYKAGKLLKAAQLGSNQHWLQTIEATYITFFHTASHQYTVKSQYSVPRLHTFSGPSLTLYIKNALFSTCSEFWFSIWPIFYFRSFKLPELAPHFRATVQRKFYTHISLWQKLLLKPQSLVTEVKNAAYINLHRSLHHSCFDSSLGSMSVYFMSFLFLN